MGTVSELTLHSALSTLLAGLLVGCGLILVVRKMGRIHPGLVIGLPVAIGFGARLIAVAGVDGTGLSASLRGGDETTFLNLAKDLLAQGLSPSVWLDTITTSGLHVAVFAAQLKVLDFPPTAMRVVQIGIALLGLLLLIAAVHELAGARASRLAAWVLLLEPAGIFFNSALHKETLMLLASGLAVYGGVRIWRNLDFAGIAIAGVGGVIAVLTRPYAGWFLVSGVVLLILHAAIRRLDRPLRAMPLIYAVALVGFLVTPTLMQVSSEESLETLQTSQDANTDEETAAQSEGQNSNNLALEEVNYSTRGDVFTNLPGRIGDVVFKPYPWQVENPSQALGAIGSLVALTGLFLLVRYAWRSRGRLLALTAPIIYPMAFLLMAYALSAGNAGTGFRYRTHIVTLSLAMLIVLYSHVRSRRAPEPAAAATRRAPASPLAPVARPIT